MSHHKSSPAAPAFIRRRTLAALFLACCIVHTPGIGAAETAAPGAPPVSSNSTPDPRVALFVRAIESMRQPSGCWACTLTTTSRRRGTTTVTVETFAPSQPEEARFTLLATNGQAPDAVAQADYRKKKLTEWRAREKRNAPARSILARGARRPCESR